MRVVDGIKIKPGESEKITGIQSKGSVKKIKNHRFLFLGRRISVRTIKAKWIGRQGGRQSKRVETGSLATVGCRWS